MRQYFIGQLFQAFRFKIDYCSNDYILYFMIIINIVLSLKVLTACLSHDRDLHEIKVVYDHTRFASYLHLSVGNVGGEYDYWLLEGNKCSAAWGFPSNPILSWSAPNNGNIYSKSHTT
jgi:hypothetical protein